MQFSLAVYYFSIIFNFVHKYSTEIWFKVYGQLFFGEIFFNFQFEASMMNSYKMAKIFTRNPIRKHYNTGKSIKSFANIVFINFLTLFDNIKW